MLTKISPPDFDIILDIRYATPDNFTGNMVYAKPLCFLHKEAAAALRKSIELAAQNQFKFRIFDAFRPKEAQELLWNHTPDPEFLSNPETGSCPHCRGVAIDLTLIDKDGFDLDMGTGFDEFSPRSHHGNEEVSPTAQKNREYLKEIMIQAGWDFYKNEWWHYQLFNCRDYELLTDEMVETGIVA